MDNTFELTDEFIITKQFATANDFSIFIENRAMREGMSLMDTIIAYCDEADIDIEVTAKLVTKSLKEKIRVEAEAANLMKREEGVLPI